MLARIGLISMLLLTLGPLIGQLSAVKMSSGVMPSMSSSDMMMSGHDHSGSHHDNSGGHHDHSKMNHAWYEQCGYCSLALNFPFLSSTIPNIIRDVLQAAPRPVVLIRSAFKSNTLFLLALTRAPPFLFR
ncbi:MAG: DUF2946 domain-containing protein [Marinomonas sp.]